ncbi:MAG TPA: transglutaminase family protein, partial [Blastocatellia bacterium]|nr:transglutaminase family protein [Blastocatellia bacterium]
MRLNAGCEITFEVSEPTAMMLMLRPRSGYGQWVARETYTFSENVPIVEYVDSYGNLYQRLIAPAGNFVITTTAEVETMDAIDVHPGTPYTLVQQLPDNVLQFLLPSRYCQSDLLGDLASQITNGVL